MKRAKNKISKDGKAGYLDNIVVKRLWGSLRYECVYLHAWESGSQKAESGRWVTIHNHPWPHAAHDGQPRAEVYFSGIKNDWQMQAVA